LTVLAVAAGQFGVWYAYATDKSGSLWLAVPLAIVGAVVIVVAARMGARLSGEGNGRRPAEEHGEDR
jgi:hypothetical protein